MAEKTSKKRSTTRTKKPNKKTAKRGLNSAAKQYAARADKGAPASVALDRMKQPQRSIAWAADAAIRELSRDIEAKVSWGNAGYKIDGHDLFAICEQKTYVSVYFGNGALLGEHDEANLLEGSGKLLRHVKLRAPDEAASGSFRALLRAALAVAKQDSMNAWNKKRIKS